VRRSNAASRRFRRAHLATGAAHAQGIGHSGMYTMPPNWGMMMDKLTPEQRSQAIDIQEKMMKLNMEKSWNPIGLG
jgi:hypothetical protein